MKSELTKQIEKALSTYNPAELGGFEINYRRRQYLEYEVPVVHSHIEGGLVDAVWLSEGFRNPSTCMICGAAKRIAQVEHLTRGVSCALTESELRSIGPGTFFPCLYEKKCFWKREHRTKEEAVAVMCFEIKISKSDFKSPNGHNFVGNINCYVMPYQLFKQLKDEIPEGIGVITFHQSDDGRTSLRRQVQPTWKDLPDNELYLSMLHTILNKKDKLINKLNRKHREQLSVAISNGAKAIRDVIKSDRAKVTKPDCYEPLFGHCGASYTCSEGANCIFSSRYCDRYINALEEGVYHNGTDDLLL